jgi:type VI secretion system protein ImpA
MNASEPTPALLPDPALDPALEPLLAPLPGPLPCGEDLLFSADFDAIQQARRFDDPSLDQGEWVTDIKEADWAFVVARSTSLLEEKTKDLRLAVWLTEGLAIEQGLAGLTNGYRILTGLCQRFWDALHPLAEDADNEYRLGYIGWLAVRTAQLLRAMPVVDSPAGRYSTLEWEIAANLVQALKREPDNSDDLARGKVTADQFDTARRATPPAFFGRLLAELDSFERAMLALESELDARAALDAPSFRPAREGLEAVRSLVERFAREAGLTPGKPARREPGPAGSGAHPMAHPGMHPETRHEPIFTETPTMSDHSSGPLRSRSQALAQLREVAEFFRRTEPHSPVALLAEKAAAWGEMSLTDWLRTVVKDEASLSRIEEQLGVAVRPEPNKAG